MSCNCGNLLLHHDARDVMFDVVNDKMMFSHAWNRFASKYTSRDEWLLGMAHWIDVADAHLGVPPGDMWICPTLPDQWVNPSIPGSTLLLAGLRITVAGLNKDGQQIDALLSIVEPEDLSYVLCAVLHTASSIVTGELPLRSFQPEKEGA